MFHDPNFMPFDPPKDRPDRWMMLKNYLAAIPASYYEEPFTLQRGIWPFGDVALVTDPELIEELLITRADEFLRDRVSSQALGGSVARGSLLLAEDAWLPARARSPLLCDRRAVAYEEGDPPKCLR